MLSTVFTKFACVSGYFKFHSPKHISFIIANLLYSPNNFSVTWPVFNKIFFFMFGVMFVARQKYELRKCHAIMPVIKWELIKSGMGDK